MPAEPLDPHSAEDGRPESRVVWSLLVAESHASRELGVLRSAPAVSQWCLPLSSTQWWAECGLGPWAVRLLVEIMWEIILILFWLIQALIAGQK